MFPWMFKNTRSNGGNAMGKIVVLVARTQAARRSASCAPFPGSRMVVAEWKRVRGGSRRVVVVRRRGRGGGEVAATRTDLSPLLPPTYLPQWRRRLLCSFPLFLRATSSDSPFPRPPSVYMNEILPEMQHLVTAMHAQESRHRWHRARYSLTLRRSKAVWTPTTSTLRQRVRSRL